MILGKELVLTVSEYSEFPYLYPLAACKSCSIKLDTNFLEVCAPNQIGVTDHIPTWRSWSTDASTLFSTDANYKRLYDIWKNKTPLWLCFFDSSRSNYYKGKAYLKSVDKSGDIGGLAKISVSFQTSGDLSYNGMEYMKLAKEDVNKGLVFGTNGFTGMKPGSTTTIAETDFHNASVRFGALGPVAIVNLTQAQVSAYITNNNFTALNNKLLLYEGRGGEEITKIVKGVGKCTVITDSADTVYVAVVVAPAF